MANIAKTPRGPNSSERPPPPKKNNHQTGKGKNKRGASNDGDAARKSPKRTGAEDNDNKKKDIDTNGAPVDSEHLTKTDRKGDDDNNKDAGTNGAPEDFEPLATDGPDTSSTKHDSPTTPHDQNADRNPETNEQKDAGTDSHSIFETPVRNTTVSKNGFFQFGKTRLSNLTIIFHNSSSYTRNPYFYRGYYQPPKVARNSSNRAA